MESLIQLLAGPAFPGLIIAGRLQHAQPANDATAFFLIPFALSST